MDSKQFTNILYRFISHKPWALVIAIFATTIFFLVGSLRLEFDPSIKSMVPKQNEFLQTMEEIDDLFGGTTIVVLAVESDSLLFENTLSKYKEFADSLADIDVIEKVVSIYSATRMTSSEEGFQVTPLIIRYPKNVAEVDSLKDYLSSTSRVIGNIISDDFRMMSFICQLTVSYDYDEHELVNTIEELVKQLLRTFGYDVKKVKGVLLYSSKYTPKEPGIKKYPNITWEELHNSDLKEKNIFRLADEKFRK